MRMTKYADILVNDSIALGLLFMRRDKVVINSTVQSYLNILLAEIYKHTNTSAKPYREGEGCTPN